MSEPTVTISLRDLSRQIAQERGCPIEIAQQIAEEQLARASANASAASEDDLGEVEGALLAAGKLPSEARRDAARLFSEEDVPVLSVREIARQIASERGVPIETAQQIAEDAVRHAAPSHDERFTAPSAAPTHGDLVPVDSVADAVRVLHRRTNLPLDTCAAIVTRHAERGGR